jgi:hypothetical protein
LLLGWLAFGPKVRQRRRALQFSLGLLAAALIWQAACGGGGGAPPVQHIPGTPSGTYTFTISASTGQLQHSLTATLTVR